MKRMNYCVAETHESKDFVMEISAPFSAAAQAENGLMFYKRLQQEKFAVQKELEQITTDLIIQINTLLPRIISIADPYANPVTVSETHIREFSLPYLFRFLKGLKTTSGGVVHICPYSSSLLEKYGFVRVEIVSFSSKPYMTVLSEYTQTGHLVFIGHQCIHTPSVNKIFLLHISDGIL
jgi:uroporphyrinogen-III decarboxylase